MIADDTTYADEAKEIAHRAPRALRDLTRDMLEEMDAADPHRPRLATTREAEVERILVHASEVSWRHALAQAGADVLGVEPRDAAAHPAVQLAESLLEL
ncbi:MAG TPA: hypothetical protein VGI54_02620 [Solirubrobacteraceae bacterium]